MRLTRNIIQRFGLPLVSCGLMIGCAKPVNEADLIGVYTAAYPFAKETLSIARDGTFTQLVALSSNGLATTAIGTWTLSVERQNLYLSKEFLIVVDGFGDFIPLFANTNTSLKHILPVSRSFGRPQLGVDPGVLYHRD